jgi:integrase
MTVHVVQGKGRKDRYVRLPDTLLKTLRAYWRETHPKTLLFPGVEPDRPLSENTIQRDAPTARLVGCR